MSVEPKHSSERSEIASASRWSGHLKASCALQGARRCDVAIGDGAARLCIYSLSISQEVKPPQRGRKHTVRHTFIVLGLFALLLSGCHTFTPTCETQESYAIYDIKPTQGVAASKIAEAVKVGLQRGTNELRVKMGIPPSPLPSTPGRFSLENPLGRFAALAAQSCQSVQFPTCNGAILTAQGERSYVTGQKTIFFACLLPYQSGYHLDFHTTFTKKSGGVSAQALASTLVDSTVGDSSQFIPTIINRVVRHVQEAGAEVMLVEAYP